MTTPISILYLAANPIGTERLSLEKEVDLITARLQKPVARGLIKFVPVLAAKYSDLSQAILEHQPAVIHFSGHADEENGEIILEDGDKQPSPLSTEALDTLLGAFRGTVRLVVLDACGTEPQAEAIKDVVGCVIGTNKKIGDIEAIAFAAEFYGAIGARVAVRTAFDLGRAALAQLKTGQQDIPVLLTHGVDASELYPLGGEPSSGPKNLNLGRVPIPADVNVFVGRKERVKELTEAWERGDARIVQLVASGGVGKSTIVWHWLEGLKETNYSGLKGAPAIDWSFYSQGQHAYVTHSQNFLAAAARQLGIVVTEAMQSQPEQLGTLIAQKFVETGGLMILDGVEPLQERPEVRNGALKDPGLIGFFRYLRTAPPPRPGQRRLVIVTTRWEIPDLKGSGIKTIELLALDAEHGADLLQQVRVRGQGLHYNPPDQFREECLKTSREYDGHALALLLLASYLLRGYDGDLARRDRVRILPDERPGDPYRYARRVLRSYEEMFDDAKGPEAAACRRVLCLVGLFDRPAALRLIAQVRAGVPMPGLTDKLDDEQFAAAVEELRKLRLLTGKPDGADATIDAHPLIREHFGKLLKNKYPEEYRGAHRRLYEYLRTSALPLPETLPEMEPLLEAVVHGCKAGRHKEALDEVYLPRIMRAPQSFAADKLGALVPLVSVLSHFFEPDSWDRPVVQTEPGGAGLPEGDQLRVLIDSGRYLTATRGYAADEVLRAYTKAEEIGKRLKAEASGQLNGTESESSESGSPDGPVVQTAVPDRVGTESQMIEIGYGLWRCHLVQASLRDAVNIAGELEKRVAGHGPDYQLMAKRTLAASYFFRGEFAAARRHAEEGVALGVPADSGLGVLLGEVAVTCRCYGALALWLRGEQVRAEQESDTAIRMAERDGHPHTLALALFLDGWLRQLKGDFNRVRTQSARLRSLSDDAGLVLWSAGATCQHGWARFAEGWRKEGLAEMKAGLKAWEETGALLITPFWLYHLARASVGENLAEAQEYADRALRLVEQRGERMWEAELLRLKGEVLMAISRSHVTRAQECFTGALKWAREQNAPALIAAAESSLASYQQPHGYPASTAAPLPPTRLPTERSLLDATEYQFVAGDRRLIVRHAEPDGAPADQPISDLPTAARAYAEQCARVLDANVAVAPAVRTAHGAEAVPIAAELPNGPWRVALLRFEDGPLVELTLTAGPNDPGVDAEFARLIASARPATTIAPQTAVARAIAAGPRGSDGYPVGPLTLDIPPVYTAPFVFVLAAPDGGERYTVERTPSENETVLRGTVIGPPLALHGVRLAISPDGLPVRYEQPPPRATSGENAPGSSVSLNVSRGGTSLPSRGAAVGAVRGTAVRVYFAGPAASAEVAQQLLEALNTAR